MMNLILWLSIIWLPFLMYFLFKREAKLDKPIVLEVTLSAEARHGDKAKEIIRRFNLTQFITMLVFLLVAIPCFLIKDIGTALSLYCTWITLCIVLPFIPYIKTRNKLLKLQREYGYFCKEDTFWKLGVFYFNPEDKHFS